MPERGVPGVEVRVQAGPTGISPVGFLMGWSLNVLGILGSLADRLEPAQRELATDLVEAWGLTLRQLLTQFGQGVHVYGPDILPDLRLVFQRGRDLAAKVEAYRGLDTDAVRKAIEYFDTQLAEVDSYAGWGGGITCESWVFDQVVWHLKDLLTATLGGAHTDAFAAAYDVAIRQLQEDDSLARASRN